MMYEEGACFTVMGHRLKQVSAFFQIDHRRRAVPDHTISGKAYVAPVTLVKFVLQGNRNYAVFWPATKHSILEQGILGHQ